ncbi:hypothetical protein [Candidatus Ulvibacter alkanivorans]|uniref:hypothetical protein n=1 Tax=Candidatus Ulvibacter alkanivorans TaxID=2267620 RepID=UPI00109C4D6C|nr:hypothetical protein [Candidatus Ulvibacter alkanivorans]
MYHLLYDTFKALLFAFGVGALGIHFLMDPLPQPVLTTVYTCILLSLVLQLIKLPEPKKS